MFDPTTQSTIGSPNIFLKKNFDRGHIYQGYYLILDVFKENLLAYLPVIHLKLSYKCRDEIMEALKMLAYIDKSDEERCEQFIQMLDEYKGIRNIHKAGAFGESFKAVNISNADVVFMSIDEALLLRDLIQAYIYLYKDSSYDYRGFKQTPLYTFEVLLMMKNLLGNLQSWIASNQKSLQ